MFSYQKRVKRANSRYAIVALVEKVDKEPSSIEEAVSNQKWKDAM